MYQRKRGVTLSNDIKRQLDQVVDDRMSAENAILHLMKNFGIGVETLKASDNKEPLHTFATTTATMHQRRRGDTLSNDMERQLDQVVDDRTSAETAILHLKNIFDIDLEKLKASETGLTSTALCKRKRGDRLSNHDVERHIIESIDDQTSAEMVVLHLIENFEFDLQELKDRFMDIGFRFNFSRVKYQEVAPFVGLRSPWDLLDAPLFDLHRSRIPTALFKDIVMDMDVMQIQYGNLESQSEEMRSLYFAPIFNRLVAQFGGFIHCRPESFTNGCKKQFETFSAVTVMFAKMKLLIRGKEERLNAIAQVIAECDVYDWNNMKLDLTTPIYGILCDRNSFQFFTFDGSTQPYKFSLGVLNGRCFNIETGVFLLDDIWSEDTTSSFINDLRPICEIIFNILLVSYIASLKIFRDISPLRYGQPKNLDGWNKAIKFAEEALERSQEVEVLYQKNLIVDADATTEAAFKALKLSTEAVPDAYEYAQPLLMSGWNDDEVAKA